jgi:hypothetical protein
MTTSVTAATTAHLMLPRTHNIEDLDMKVAATKFDPSALAFTSGRS